MAIKTTGAEFKAFYTDENLWPNRERTAVKDGEVYNVWHEDEAISIDNEAAPEDLDYASIADDAKVTLSGGVIWNSVRGQAREREVCSFETYFRRWRKAQTTEVLVVEIPKGKREELVAALTQVGGKLASVNNKESN